MVRSVRVALAGVLLLSAALVIASGDAHANPNVYRRWANGKSWSCTDTGSGVDVVLGDQNVEFSGLPVSATYMLNYIDNGATTSNGPFPVEQTSGTHAYGSFLEHFPAYPLTFDFRLDTIVGGTVVYQSTIHVACSADSSGTVDAVNSDVSAPGFRRWTDGKTYSCVPNGAGVAVTLSNQDIEVFNLPAGAQYTLHYIDNGVDTPSGPFNAEAAGIHNYGSFLEAFPSYPFTFDFRIDTIVDGTVIYHSNLHMECTSDVAGLTPVEDSGAGAVPPPSTSSTTTTSTTNGSSTTTTVVAGGGRIPVTGGRTHGSTLAALLLLLVGAAATAGARRRPA
ncbi:MAG: hypothetical protein M9961_15730 [Ilumatobacteraceae bacterium]|nr:hypothetical protein [Ilumatobacter sp.]MCO5331520.1 hypothetical protein [Ilumatobacteraceae bacterium]